LRTAVCGDAGKSEKPGHGAYSFHCLPRKPHLTILRPLAIALGRGLDLGYSCRREGTGQ
jgi:hypothetical protein